MGFASILPWLTPGALAVCSGLVLAVLLFPASRPGFRMLMRRTRVLLLALILLYGFGTPGVSLFPGLGGASPTMEGLEQGGLQAWRLVLVLASLALLSSHLGRTGLTAGLYALVLPLKRLGLPIHRFAVRLALVLDLTGSLPPVRWNSGLSAALASPCPELPAKVEFDLPPMTKWDVLFALCSLWLFGWLLW